MSEAEKGRPRPDIVRCADSLVPSQIVQTQVETQPLATARRLHLTCGLWVKPPWGKREALNEHCSERSAVHVTPDSEVARFRGSGNSHFDAGNWCEYGHLFGGQRAAAESASLSAAGSYRGSVS